MGWKATGGPVVQCHRGRWVVRVGGIDTETGKRRPRQLGTYESRRAAASAARTVSCAPSPECSAAARRSCYASTRTLSPGLCAPSLTEWVSKPAKSDDVMISRHRLANR